MTLQQRRQSTWANSGRALRQPCGSSKCLRIAHKALFSHRRFAICSLPFPQSPHGHDLQSPKAKTEPISSTMSSHNLLKQHAPCFGWLAVFWLSKVTAAGSFVDLLILCCCSQSSVLPASNLCCVRSRLPSAPSGHAGHLLRNQGPGSLSYSLLCINQYNKQNSNR